MLSPMLLLREETVGAAPPPPGVTPNFVNPPSRAHITIIINVVCLIVSTLCVMMRLYTALVIMRAHGIGDYLLAISWVFALIYSVLFCVLIRYGYGRHIWDIPFSTFNINFMKIGAIVGTFYGMSIMLTKLSILCFYLKFVLNGKLRTFIFATMVVVVIYSVVASFEWVYACRPVEKYWDFTVEGSCINWVKITVFSGVMNSVTDAIILVLPTIFLRHLRLPLRQKIGVMMIMMTGGMVLGVSIIRVKFQVDSLSFTDITWQTIWSSACWVIEAHLALVCACLPAGKPFLRRYFPKVFGSYGASEETRTRTARSDARIQHYPSRDGDEVPLNVIGGDSLGRRVDENPAIRSAGKGADENTMACPASEDEPALRYPGDRQA